MNTFVDPKIMRECSGRRIVAGVTFVSYSTGINRYVQISADGQLMTQANNDLTHYYGYVLGHGPALSKTTGKAKKFRTQAAAARAAIKLKEKARG